MKTIVLMIAALLLMPVAATAQQLPPNAIVYVLPACLDPTDIKARTEARTDCDNAAESEGYVHGVLRPVTPYDKVEIKCEEGTEPYVCVGVNFCDRKLGCP